MPIYSFVEFFAADGQPNVCPSLIRSEISCPGNRPLPFITLVKSFVTVSNGPARILVKDAKKAAPAA
jgi:hypothetical protein